MMKYVLAAFAIMFLFGACQKEINGEFINLPSDTTPTNPTTGIIRAKVDGVEWTADQSATATAIPYDSNRHFVLTIIGTKTDGTALQLIMEDFHTGTFDMTDSLIFNGGVFHEPSGDFDTGNDTTTGVIHGTIHVTTIDTLFKTISGTFSFVGFNDSATESRTITNGEFTAVPYIKNAGVPPASVTDTFHVDIDSNLYNRYGLITATAGIDLAIATSDSTGDKVLNINVPYGITAGTYAFNDTTYKAVYVETGRDTLKASGGMLQIVENNTSTKRLRGNFSFTAYNNSSPPDSSVFTSGYFAIDYP